ncbi:uncharacterized protein BJ171DRAFT_487553 [Polychytrium aggregatum]|uniref:uncharacterized protein n=1 Tax=Polychytrium aggregatum TaxID=110093 RepID=UPI0022FE10D1|nr:uncharacterized protein BJ171DRAFT_487553 [Polychytrium aggregatum]KAI9208883.1 hypothetical protein BJ171DRAFT_487553 [Polychytrium aggregatum]
MPSRAAMTKRWTLNMSNSQQREIAHNCTTFRPRPHHWVPRLLSRMYCLCGVNGWSIHFSDGGMVGRPTRFCPGMLPRRPLVVEFGLLLRGRISLRSSGESVVPWLMALLSLCVRFCEALRSFLSELISVSNATFSCMIRRFSAYRLDAPLFSSWRRVLAVLSRCSRCCASSISSSLGPSSLSLAGASAASGGGCGSSSGVLAYLWNIATTFFLVISKSSGSLPSPLRSPWMRRRIDRTSRPFHVSTLASCSVAFTFIKRSWMAVLRTSCRLW